MDIKKELFEAEDTNVEIPDVPDKLKYLEEIKNENIDIKTEEQVELKCSGCDETFTDEVALKIHEMFHSKTNYCVICKKNMVDFHRHIRRRHLNHVCKICSKVFPYKCRLEAHIASHMDDRQFKCGQCDKSFKQRTSMTYHFTTTHMGIKLFACTICEKEFATSSSQRQHLRRQHNGNKKLDRRISDKLFDVKKNDHEKCHTISHECEICGKIFNTLKSKLDHLKRHNLKLKNP